MFTAPWKRLKRQYWFVRIFSGKCFVMLKLIIHITWCGVDRPLVEITMKRFNKNRKRYFPYSYFKILKVHIFPDMLYKWRETLSKKGFPARNLGKLYTFLCFFIKKSSRTFDRKIFPINRFDILEGIFCMNFPKERIFLKFSFKHFQRKNTRQQYFSFLVTSITPTTI